MFINQRANQNSKRKGPISSPVWPIWPVLEGRQGKRAWSDRTPLTPLLPVQLPEPSRSAKSEPINLLSGHLAMRMAMLKAETPVQWLAGVTLHAACLAGFSESQDAHAFRQSVPKTLPHEDVCEGLCWPP